MGFWSAVFNNKKKFGFVAVSLGCVSYDFFRGWGEVYNRMWKMSRLEIKYRHSPNALKSKIYILVDSFNGNEKPTNNVGWGAIPILEAAQSKYAILPVDSKTDLEGAYHLMGGDNEARILLAGDDYFIHNQLNFISVVKPQILKNKTIGILPAGKVNRFYDKIAPNNLTPHGKVAEAMTICLLGERAPIYPLILKKNTSSTQDIVVDSVKTGQIAYYENMLMLNEYRYLRSLKYYACLVNTYIHGGKPHKCDINICDKENISLSSHSMCITYNPIDAPQMIINSKNNKVNPFSYNEIQSIYKNFDNSFLTEKDETIAHKKMKCTITMASDQKERQNNPILYDGVLLVGENKDITIEQSEVPLFHIYSPYVTYDLPNALPLIPLK